MVESRTRLKGVSAALAAAKSKPSKARRIVSSREAVIPKRVAVTEPKVKKAKTEVRKAPVKKKAKGTLITAPGGQSGPAIVPKRLNAKEVRVFDYLAKNRGEASISEMASGLWPKQGAAKANSWVRNSLRRLVRAGWVDRVGRGSFRISAAGRKTQKAA